MLKVWNLKQLWDKSKTKEKGSFLFVATSSAKILQIIGSVFPKGNIKIPQKWFNVYK
jgi:hypothetical protein